jgi:hypothetical protein
MVCPPLYPNCWISLSASAQIHHRYEGAAQQVKDLAVRNQRPKVITADSRYRDKHFLGAFADLENTYALVRLQNNQVLSQEPVPKPKGSRGAPRKHGADFQLNAIEREPDALEEFSLGKQKVRVRVWHQAAFQAAGQSGGSVVCVEFLKEDGTPRYKRPLWLFWTGSGRGRSARPVPHVPVALRH